MFKSISWQEYFLSISILLGGYYIISILLLYSKEVVQNFKSSKKDSTESKKETSPNSLVSLMGKVQVSEPKIEENSQPEIVQSEGICVVLDSNLNSNSQEVSDALLVGSVSDLLQEIKTLLISISENNGSKDESIFMVQSLLGNYFHLSSTKYQEAITVFLYEECKSNCSFELGLAEIKMLWPLESQNS